jgi:APA family basic amino acid/polyamine antiporter
MVQNVFTIAKVGAVLGLVGLGLLLGRNTNAMSANFSNFWANADWGWTSIRLVGVAMVGSLFSADAWNNITFTAGEVRNPKRNLPLSLALGVGIVMLLYLSANLVYLMTLPLDAIKTAAEDRVATASASVILGPVAVQIMAAAIMISSFGCMNGLILAGARVYFAMARHGLFFKSVGVLDPVHHAPRTSLIVQCVWCILLTLSGSYSNLLDYVIFAALLFYIMTIAGLFVLRRKRPDLERPYRAFGYPVLPLIYIVAAITIEVLLLMYKPSYTWPGLIIVLLGIPVYFIWKPKGA